MKSSKTEKQVVYIARNKVTGKYAAFGKISGFESIEERDSVWLAQKFLSPIEIMMRMGGHYNGYEALEIEIAYKIRKAVAFPPASEVFDS